MSKSPTDQYADSEARQRLEDALRGARVIGHKPMKAIAPKRDKPQRKGKTPRKHSS